MQSFKIIKISLIIIISFSFVFGITSTDAAEGNSNLEYEMEVGIPGSDYSKGDTFKPSGNTSDIGNYIKAIYNYGIGIAGILAVVVIMIGGVVWLTAGGNTNKVESAKQWIGGALSGLVLVLTSYMLLYQINPNLVEFRNQEITTITSTTTPETGGETGCCTYSIQDKGGNLTKEECKAKDGTFHSDKEWNSNRKMCVTIGCCYYDDMMGCEEISKNKCESKGSGGRKGTFYSDKTCSANGKCVSE